MERENMRKSRDEVLSGTLGGIANYFDIDPFFIRLPYAILAVVTGFIPMAFLYLIMSICMLSARD